MTDSFENTGPTAAAIGGTEGGADEPRRPHRPGLAGMLWTLAGLPLLFLLGVKCASLALEPAVAVTYDWEQRIEFFRANSDDYNAIAVGTSRFYHGFDPRQLSERAKTEGIDLRPFVIGVSGFRAHDLDYVLARLGDSLRGKLVIIDAPRFKGEAREVQLSRRFGRTHTLAVTRSYILTGAFEYLHLGSIAVALADFHPGDGYSWVETKNELRYIFRSMQVSAFVETSYAHVMMFLMNHIPVGQARQRTLGESEGLDPDYADQLRSSGGYFPEPRCGLQEEFPREVEGGTFHSWEEWLEAISAMKVDPVRAFDDSALRRQIRLVMRHDPQDLLYLEYPHALSRVDVWSPRIERGTVRNLGDPGDQPVFLDFNRPLLYPDLFLADERIDVGHLNATGTVRFMDRLADILIPHLRNDAEGRVYLDAATPG